MTRCKLLFLLAFILLLLFVNQIESFRAGIESPYSNSGIHLLGEQKPQKLSLLRYLP